MDQKTIEAGGILTGVIGILAGVLVSPVAIGLTVSYPHELWWLGAILCVCCFLMIAGGIGAIRTARQKEKLAKLERERIDTELAQQKSVLAFADGKIVDQPNAAPSAVPLHPEVLAYWTFSAEEWKQFMALEKRTRLESSIYEGIGIIILGTFVIMLARDADFLIALSVSSVIAVIIAFLRYSLNMKSFGPMLPNNEVTITKQSVLINDKLNPIRSDTIWLDKLELKAGAPDVLEFTLAWHNRRKQKVTDEIRIPIPSEKKYEAQQLIPIILNPYR
jgi:hypothetical protein